MIAKTMTRLQSTISRFALCLALGVSTLVSACTTQNAGVAKGSKKFFQGVVTGTADKKPLALQQDTTGIYQLRQDFSRTAAGRRLLQLADSAGVFICYDSGLQKRWNALGAYEPVDDTLSIMRGMTREEEIVTLAHELRHAWQDAVLGWYRAERNNLSPLRIFALRRFCEADAYAYSAWFLADRAEQLGMSLDSLPSNENFADEIKTAKRIYYEKQQNNGTIRDEFYRESVLVYFFAHLGQYNRRHNRLAVENYMLFEGVLNAIDNKFAEGNKKQKKDAARRAIKMYSFVQSIDSDEKFYALLRRLGGYSLDINAPSSIADTAVVKNRDLLDNYPYREKITFSPVATNRVMRQQVENFEGFYKEAQDRLKNMLYIMARRYARRHHISRPPVQKQAAISDIKI